MRLQTSTKTLAQNQLAKNPSFPIIDDSLSYTPIKELTFEYHNFELSKANYDIRGFFQSESYFNKKIVMFLGTVIFLNE